MDKVNIYVVTTAKGPSKQKIAGYFLIEHIKDGIPITKDGKLFRDKATGLELTLKLLINAVYLVSKANVEYETLVIATKEPIIDNAFNKKWVDNWKESDWKNKKGCAISNSDDWQQLCELLDGLSKRYLFSNESTSYFNIMTRWSESYLRLMKLKDSETE